MPSIQFKKSKTGKKTYYVVVSFQGKHKWIKAGTQKEAKELKRKVESMENSQRLEKLGLVSKNKRIDEFLQEYSEHVKLRTSSGTIKRYLGILNTFIVFLKMFHTHIRYLSQIKPEHIESYQKQRLESIELKAAADGDKAGNHRNKRLPLPQTVNYEVNVLRSAFMWAYDRELIARVPTKKVKPLREKPKRQARILTPKECDLFLKTCRKKGLKDTRFKVFYQIFKFLLNTGLRSGELCNLTWEDVNLETGLIKIQPKEGWTPKSYSREFFFNEICLDLLKSIDCSQGFIFVNQLGNQFDTDDIRRALIKVAKEAGFNDLTRVHDFRHTFNSLMQMNGVDPATMGRILGHRDIETTMIYTHQTQEHLKKSIEKVWIT
ncbi:MAG: tyrosine-type recombinase/integrase [candidate division Zixibacteria bacterium]|nr:tyrosine-type recombinase/integrase [candidate division Zixibacteria bacterium]